MKKLLLSREAQLEVVKQHTSYLQDFELSPSRDPELTGMLDASERYMCLIFGNAKFKYMEFEISRQWARPGGPNWDYEAILDADDPFIPIKNQRKEMKRALAKARKALAEIRVIQDR